jgi:hypothetical protein
MACVPGGKVMAKVMGAPLALASITMGLSAFGSEPTLPLSSALRLIDCPFRLIIHGITIGFLGDPSRPMVDAMGMPVSMCVPWRSPLERASRTAAQLACLATVELIPYFLKRPFSWAMTIGEQSVSAIIPNFTSGVSGASLAYAVRALRNRAAARPAAAPSTSRRAGREGEGLRGLLFASFIVVLDIGARRFRTPHRKVNSPLRDHARNCAPVQQLDTGEKRALPLHAMFVRRAQAR